MALNGARVCAMPMTPDAVVRSWFNEIWNEGREEAIDRLADDNFIAHGAPSLRSTADFRVVYQQFHQALSDINITVERTVTQGDYCAGYCRVKARHTGDGFGAAPTNRIVEFDGVVMARVRDGKIVEGWNCFDFLSMYQQIGWVNNPPTP
jgi:predicted ester cyclase